MLNHSKNYKAKIEEVNFKLLCKSIIRVAPKAPLTYISETTLIFRGRRMEIAENRVKTTLFEFEFESPEGFLNYLQQFGLMLNFIEKLRVLEIYRKEKSC